MDNAQVYIINLDRATDRWKKWENINMGFPSLNVHRFSAIDGKNITDDQMRQYTTPLSFLKILGGVKRSPEDMDNKGALACSLSHFTLWDKFLIDHPDSQYMIVFEDDNDVSDKYKKELYNILADAIDKLPADWDIWLIGSALIRESVDWYNPGNLPKASELLKNPTKRYNTNSKYRDVRSVWGTNAYIIKRDSIPKISKYNFPIETHIDLYLSVLAQNGYIRIINDKTINMSQNSVLGYIPHNIFTIALLNQGDVIYKVIFFIFFIIVLILFYIYIIKGCFGYNFFNFLGNRLSCKL